MQTHRRKGQEWVDAFRYSYWYPLVVFRQRFGQNEGREFGRTLGVDRQRASGLSRVYGADEEKFHMVGAIVNITILSSAR